MDNKTFSQIKDLVLKNQDIGVLVKPNPNLDEMAAGLGMYLVLKQMGKAVSIVCPTDPIVALSSLVGIDKVEKTLSVGATGDLTVSFPYKEGEIEKVSYTLDNGLLNIVVKAGEKGLSFQQSDVAFKRNGKAPTLVFFVGIAHMNDVASVYVQNPAQPATIVNIDNKQDNEKFGTICVADPKWSSVSEQVADFVTLLEPQIELDRDTAQNLLNGITFATENFTKPQISYLAFEVAGILMKKGATRQRALEVSQAAKGAGVLPNANQFFPPQPIAQQPVVPAIAQPTEFVPQPQPVQSVQQPVVPSVYQQPVSQPTPVVQPFVPQPQPSWQPTQSAMPVQNAQPAQNAMPKQTPPDWLTPKVYKGSSIL